MLHDSILAADHVAVAALQTPHAAADADIDVVNALGLQLAGAADVVMVVGIATLDDDVVALEQRHQRMQHGIHGSGRQHQPHGARLRQRLHEVPEARRAPRTLGDRLLHDIRVTVEDHATMAGLHQALHHVGAHATQADHAEFHFLLPYVGFAAIVCLAAADDAPTVKPKCSATTFIGADMPKVCMPSTTPDGSRIALPTERRAFLHRHARRHRRRQDAVAIRRVLLLEQLP